MSGGSSSHPMQIEAHISCCESTIIEHCVELVRCYGLICPFEHSLRSAMHYNVIIVLSYPDQCWSYAKIGLLSEFDSTFLGRIIGRLLAYIRVSHIGKITLWEGLLNSTPGSETDENTLKNL